MGQCHRCPAKSKTEHKGKLMCDNCYKSQCKHVCNTCNCDRESVGRCEHCGGVEYRIRERGIE